MCGILAILGCQDVSHTKRARVLELSRRLKHRGPDWSGIYHHGNFFLSHQRLSIIDPSSGDQPLYNEDKTIIITVNGEIYNHEALRKSLKSHTFRTGSDCEVIAHLVSTLHRGLRRWYNPPWYLEDIPSTPFDPLVLRQTFENAVIKRLMTDVPFGVLLSGGLDSSLVAAVASRHLASTTAAKQWGARLHSFCVGLQVRPDLGRIEKWVLRKAFDDEENPFLPKHILYRQKEQFSDGVGYSWIDGLKAHAATIVTDTMMANAKYIYPENTPGTKEAYCYRMVFEKFFPQNAARLTVPGGPSVACSTAKALEWDASWSKNPDPSGRAALGVHLSAYEMNREWRQVNFWKLQFEAEQILFSCTTALLCKCLFDSSYASNMGYPTPFVQLS